MSAFVGKADINNGPPPGALTHTADCPPLADRALHCLDRAGRGPSLATGEVNPPQT
jgi:hypothetical protein